MGIACGGGAVYVPAAMNAKLKYYPDFAKAAGVAPVTDCTTAHAFQRAYEQYLGTHPGFDLHQPLGLTPPTGRPPRMPANLPPAKFEVKKIFNGAPFGEAPIVQLLGGAGAVLGLPVQCTGTFIAKNWILTAAHCLAAPLVLDDAGNPRPPFLTDFTEAGVPILSGANPAGSDAEFNFEGLFQTTISWSNAAGNATITDPRVPPDSALVASEITVPVLQYVDHRWTGYEELLSPSPNGGDVDFDVGLLYVPSSYDPYLPGSPNAGSALPVSLVLDESNDAMLFGWGGTQSLSLGELPTPLVGVGAFMTFTTTPNYTDALLCNGDSGGPTVREVGVPADDAGGGGVAFAVYGVAHATSQQQGATCTFVPPNAQTPGGVMQWARSDIEIDFINQTIQRWEPNFTCRNITNVITGVADFAECWGLPCQKDQDCPANYACQGSQAIVSNNTGNVCPVCEFSSASKDCSCIVGQCLPVQPMTSAGRSCVVDADCLADAPHCDVTEDANIGTCQVEEAGIDDGSTE